jgi:PAS domain S-box-containing protein
VGAPFTSSRANDLRRKRPSLNRANPEGSQSAGSDGRSLAATADIDIEHSRSLLRAVVECSAAAIGSCDNQLRITSWNKGAERILGYTAREVIGQPLRRLMTAERTIELMELLEWMRHGEQLREFETSAIRKDGTSIDIIFSASPMVGNDGSHLGASFVARDISAAENARRKLEETQRWLRETVNHAPILITATDRDGIYTMVEGQALSAFGISGAGALIGRSAFQLLGTGAPSAVATRQALAGATVQTVAEINGHFFEFWKAPQRDSQGRIIGSLSVNTDVTRRVAIERELQVRLRQQETIAALGRAALSGAPLDSLIRLAVESIGQALEADLACAWVETPDCGIFSVTALAGPMAIEVAPGELSDAGSDSLAAYAIALAAPVIAGDLTKETRFNPHPAILRQGFTSAIAIPFGPVRGQPRLLAAYSRESGKFGRDDASFIEALAHILSSAAANADARLELQRSEAYFRQVIENISDVVGVLDRHGIIRSIGGAVERMFGAREERLRGTPSIDLVPPEERPAVLKAIQNAFARPGEVVRLEFLVRSPDTTRLACEAVMKAVTGLADETLLVVSLRDISQRKRHEEALARARDAALEADRLKSAFLANMSHEIRTPINIIMGYSDLVADYLTQRGDDSQAEFLTAIARAGGRLLHTIDAILDYSKLSSRSLETAPERVRLEPLIERQLRQVSIAAQRKRLTLTYINEATDAEIWCDEYCLTRALEHLLENAIKFTHQGEVRVRAYFDGAAALRIDIIDTGIGIDPAFLPRLLEPFSQEDCGFTRRFEGSGLGLALAKGYLECNGARLCASSQKGAGSVFSLIFPRPVDCQRDTGMAGLVENS